MKTGNFNEIAALLPTFGIFIFIGLYIYAASLYPGGSQVDLESIGFDWINNYWCNLMNENGMNGMKNPARPIAIFSMIILCSSLALFFFQFAKHFVKSETGKALIQVSGTLSMTSAAFIFTRYHDIMTTVSSVFGVLVVLGIIQSIYKSGLTVFKISGIVCILLLGLNNLIYYSGIFIEHLPAIQKITFVGVLTWIVGLNLKMNNKNKHQPHTTVVRTE